MWYLVGLSYPTARQDEYFQRKKVLGNDGRPTSVRNGPYTRNVWFSTDETLVERAKKILKSKHAVTHSYHKWPDGTREGFTLCVSNNTLKEAFESLGFDQPKSEREFPEDIDEKYLPHFLRGLFDAYAVMDTNGSKAHRTFRIPVDPFSCDFLTDVVRALEKCAGLSRREVTNGCIRYGDQGHIGAIADVLYDTHWNYVQTRGLYLPHKMRRFERVRQSGRVVV